MDQNKHTDSFDNDNSFSTGISDDLDLDALLAELDLKISPDADPKPADDFWSAPVIPEKPKPADQPKIELPQEQPVPRQEHHRSSEHHSSHHHHHEEKGGFLDFVARHRGVINTCLVLTALILIGAIAAVVFLQGNADPYRGKILEGVSVAGIDVGNMTKAEALQAVKTNVGDKYFQTDMQVTIGKERLVLAPTFTHANLDVDAAVNAAYEYGRTGTPTDRQQDYRAAQNDGKNIDLTPYLQMDDSYVRSAITDIVDKMSGEFEQSGYALTGAQPALDADSYDEATECQTLVLTLGNPGSNSDIDAICEAVMDAYSRCDFNVTVSKEYLADFPDDLDLDAIYNELYIAPVEATQDASTKAITPGSCGYSFDLDSAKAQLLSADYGDVISIPMQYILPEKLDIMGEYGEVLGSCSSPVSSDSAYNKNMQLLCKSLDGYVIEPGAVFSFNTVSVSRNEANGFKKVPIHGEYCMTEDIGGGADQVASTLYVSAVNADLTVMERHTCDHACGYVMRGTELTVAHTWEDLKIRNDLDYPVSIRAKVTGSQVSIKIMGKTAPDYYIKLESKEMSKSQCGSMFIEYPSSSGYTNQQVIREGVTGGQIQLYRIKYDRATDKEISRTNEAFIDVRSSSNVIAVVNK